MSIEALFLGLTAAVNNLTAAVREASGLAPGAAVPPPTVDAPIAAKPKAATKPKPAPEPIEPAAPVETAAEAKPVEYADVKKRVLGLLQAVGRDPALAFLKETWGVASAQDLKPEQYADAVEKLQAAIDEAAAS